MSTATDPRRGSAGLTRFGRRAEEAPGGVPGGDRDRGILPTEISPALAWALTVGFLAVILTPPLVQAALDLVRRRDIQALEVFTRSPTRANRDGYEKDLIRESFARQWVRPRLQWILSQSLGFGTTDVILGRDGWLFYRGGVDYLTGPGLLDESRLGRWEKGLPGAGAGRSSPDPRPAIVAFHEDCRRAGVHLVVVPVPDKAMLQPAELTSRLAFHGPIAVPNNPDYSRFVQELRSAGVDVFDPTPMRLVPGEPPRFLRQDTHWTPGWMEAVARDLADHLKARVPLPGVGARSYAVAEAQVSHVGDLEDMLQLPPDQGRFPSQTVTVRRVFEVDGGGAWQPREGADVLLLGDSFSNIYCTTDLGWGDAAGFPAQLARSLGRDVDVIARNGAGATATRRELAHRPAVLQGTRVVIWEFAMRELTLADWEVVPLPGPRPRPGAGRDHPAGSDGPAPILLEGTVLATSHVPPPFTVPYKDCMTYLKLRVDRVVEGSYRDDALLAVLWGMRDNVLQPAARYGAGTRLRLWVVPLRKAPVSLKAVRSVDDLDDYDHPPYFALEEQAL